MDVIFDRQRRKSDSCSGSPSKTVSRKSGKVQPAGTLPSQTEARLGTTCSSVIRERSIHGRTLSPAKVIDFSGRHNVPPLTNGRKIDRSRGSKDKFVSCATRSQAPT